MEIAPNDTIPALPPLPGASPLVHIPRVGDGQTWPLASAGIAVAVAAITRRPDNYSDFFLVILTFAGLMPRVLRYSSATPSPPHQPSSNISLGASPRRRNRRYHIPGCTAPNCCVAASLSPLVDVDAMCINSNITSNIFFSSFNNVDLSHMMLVDCCVLCCRVCGPIAAV